MILGNRIRTFAYVSACSLLLMGCPGSAHRSMQADACADAICGYPDRDGDRTRTRLNRTRAGLVSSLRESPNRASRPGVTGSSGSSTTNSGSQSSGGDTDPTMCPTATTETARHRVATAEFAHRLQGARRRDRAHPRNRPRERPAVRRERHKDHRNDATNRAGKIGARSTCPTAAPP